MGLVCTGVKAKVGVRVMASVRITAWFSSQLG